MRRVVITGVGAVSPLGNSFRESWDAVKNGRSGIGPVTRFDASDLRWNAAGEVKGFDPAAYLDAREMRRLDPFAVYAVAASVMAVEDAGLFPSTGYLASGGVVIGSGRGGISTIEAALIFRGNKTKKNRLMPYLMPASTISMASSVTALKLGVKGHCLGISNACASGASAIGEAYHLIRGGHAGPVLAGGSEAPICRVCFDGYGIAGALSRGCGPSASRPFDVKRDGFVLAEGACVMVLEEMGTALKRGASILGEVVGYAGSCDAFHQTKPDAAGEARAMEMAIDDAGLKRDDIDYISTHGTSTPLGDRTEAEAIGTVFGNRAPVIPVSAIKSMTGHMLAASGAIEAAFAAMSLKEGIVPPTINLTERDKACGLNIVTQLKKVGMKTAVSSSFGFGGINAVLVLKSPPANLDGEK